MTTASANNIIDKRDNLSTEITRGWDIIKSENVVFRGYKRNYDMKKQLENIIDMCKERIEVKLQIMAINLGLDDVNDLPKDNIYPSILELSELKEIDRHLGYVPTLDPAIVKKYGKKKMKKTEVLTRGFISNLRGNLNIRINALNKELKDYNDNHSLKNTQRKNAKVIDMSFKDKAAA